MAEEEFGRKDVIAAHGRCGPKHEDRYTCKGCAYLHTEEWSYECEDDERDSGTSATCLKTGGDLGSYWYSFHSTPKWCPFLPVNA